MEKTFKPIFKDSQQAFNEAIQAGRLSTRRGSDNYVGDYMYMGTWDGVDQFKNSNTRAYLAAQPPAPGILDQLAQLIQAHKRESFVYSYQAQATDAEALGLILAHYFKWDGLEILRTCYAALEDSNFHSENETIETMIEKLEAK